ncbi:LexA family transcriptional regulator [Motilimonas sp. 1_MG-2023]|uniref:LexA family protein n=1 Tax=Motilimonas sp. 1_MG-2023 TaxID=3062672 RepID=UPI0026E37D08|nr:LexA family transcriptional regulator [Motilimonas sp. 1_MG-2023]MDO6525421.1 LexA family transcriptional regulator [Motilimonas sp. 1_MG-2023]
MNKNKFAERRKELGLTQAETARAVGVSRVSIGQWEKGETSPKGENLHSLAKVLKCDPGWLLNGQGSPLPEGFDKNVAPVHQLLHGAFPLISWVQAGDWSDISLTAVHEADHYPCPVKCSKNTFLLKVMGRSMSPVFNEGELIFVDPEVQAVDGKYVVARLEDENQATFKQLIIEDGHKFLQAANPNWPTPIQPINGNCTIVGVVISSMRLF